MLQVPLDIQVAFDRKIQQALVRREDRPDYRRLFTLNGENNRLNAIRYRNVGGPDPVSR